MSGWSDERRKAHREAIQARWADPMYRARRAAEISARMGELYADPVKGGLLRAATSARTKATHARGAIPYGTPAQKAAIKRIWSNPEFRDAMCARAAERYAAGLGINQPGAKERGWAVNSTVLKAASTALWSDPDVAALRSAVLDRLRRETPYLGDEHYLDYLARLSRQAMLDPELRALADEFLSAKLTEIYASRRAKTGA